MENEICIFDKKNHTFVIAEAGSNWKVGTYQEDIRMAEKLIVAAAEAGADAVKFQTFRADTVYAHNAGKVTLHDKKTVVDINELFENLSMKYEMIEELAKLCKKNNIMFMSTPFSIEDAKKIEPYVKIHKIASFEINHIKLLEYVASTKKPILISTGASNYEEIDFMVNFMNKNNSGKIGILQCTSNYPCDIEKLNLAIIPTLKKRYNLPIGFSDHSIDPIIGPITAVGFGARIIEKHFTVDKTLSGPDHFFAVNPSELKTMISMIRNSDRAKGSNVKKILEEEKELRKFATRSIQAIKVIKKGDILNEGENFGILRPGKQKRGAEARFLNKIE
ncbi:N-acetylneuraminate synthase family protein, partial [Nitrosopumilus sp.]|nr:N-acetylneuraminate synthase family protein [Nitrosopumilus sp.]